MSREPAVCARINGWQGAVQTLVTAYPEACKTRIKGKLPLHNAARSNTPTGAIDALVDAYPQAVRSDTPAAAAMGARRTRDGRTRRARRS